MSNQEENPQTSEAIDSLWGLKSVKGKLIPTTASRKVSDFVDPGETPGNVGLCFSGGGSIAMISALGQLRALNEMGVLGKARAISTVSGGSWALVPFTYLPDHIEDETFLGRYVEDPGDLTLAVTPEATSLNFVKPGYMGWAVTQPGIKWDKMAVEALGLIANPLVRNDRIWNYLIASHILKPFGLSDANIFTGIQNGWFAHSQADMEAIKKENKGLPAVVHTYQQGKGRIKRPYHLCNTAMFIDPDKDSYANDATNMLAPVQCTAIGTGIFANDIGYPYQSKGAARTQVGGGLVSSYAFDSKVNEVNGDDVTVKLRKKDAFSLADITANSSAFFATAIKKLGRADPQYNYWPVEGASSSNPGSHTRFADGGAIEDNGLLNMLAYDDIDKVVVFTNSLSPIWKDPHNPDKDMNLVVDPWWPTYFGYTPYQKLNKKGETDTGLPVGYHKYSDLEKKHGFSLDGKNIRYYQHNQVFDSSLFPEFLKTLKNNSSNYEGPSVYHNASIQVNDNAYFGINGRKVELLLVHYGPYKGFTEKLKGEVKKEMEVGVHKRRKVLETLGPAKPVDDMFPNLILLETHMDPFLCNLFAHFTAHVAMTQANTIKAMFA